jgi:hypothetical protein
MDNTSCENGQGTIITLADLETKLSLIGHRQHQWTARLARVAGESQMAWPQQCVEIWYTNPEFIDMPNQICFHFPAFHQVMGGESETLVCLHPSLADLVVQGMYFEGDKLKTDCLEDWDRFWAPLQRLL